MERNNFVQLVSPSITSLRHRCANHLLEQDHAHMAQRAAVFISSRQQLNLNMLSQLPDQLRLLKLNLTISLPILTSSTTGHPWMMPLILSCHMVIKLHQGKKFMHIFLVFFMASLLKGDYQHLQNFTRGCDLPRLKGLLTDRRY